MRKLIPVLALLLVVVSCGVKDVKTETFSRNLAYTLPEGAPEQMAGDTMKINYNLALPVDEKWAGARESVIKSVIAENTYNNDDTLSIDSHIKSLVDNFYKEFNTFMEEHPTLEGLSFMPPFSYNYSFDGGFMEPCKEHKLITYKVSCETFTGGAHGMYWETYLTFNTEDGMQVKLQDILSEDRLPALRDLIYEKLTENDGFVPDYITPDCELATDNIVFTDTELTFVYNPYDVAPYSSGLIAIPVTWEEIETIKNAQ